MTQQRGGRIYLPARHTRPDNSICSSCKDGPALAQIPTLTQPLTPPLALIPVVVVVVVARVAISRWLKCMIVLAMRNWPVVALANLAAAAACSC